MKEFNRYVSLEESWIEMNEKKLEENEKNPMPDLDNNSWRNEKERG